MRSFRVSGFVMGAITKQPESRLFTGALAEREGFEPSIELPLFQFSRLARSTAPAPLRVSYRTHPVARPDGQCEGAHSSGLERLRPPLRSESGGCAAVRRPPRQAHLCATRPLLRALAPLHIISTTPARTKITGLRAATTNLALAWIGGPRRAANTAFGGARRTALCFTALLPLGARHFIGLLPIRGAVLWCIRRRARIAVSGPSLSRHQVAHRCNDKHHGTHGFHERSPS